MTRAPLIRVAGLGADELVVDNFAGGGGASTGIEAAIGRPVDIAINHDPEAIAVHQANHPGTRHYLEDVWAVDPREACGGRPVGLAWFSPDCTHFSRAKGSRPREQGIRGLAWVVIRWAREVGPRIIILENVEEFLTWGPLDDEGFPIAARAGETFREWFSELAALGYEIEFKTLVAADYGAPTTRRRLFIVARRDGRPAWPEPTHGIGRAPWRPAAEIIDWSLPCPSIFDRQRPLAEATLRRIARGIQRYVLEAADPFIIPLTHQGDARVHGVDEPVRTVTGARRGELALVEPFLTKYHGGDAWRGQALGEPLRTVDAANRFAVVEPFIVRHGHYSTKTGAGLREGCGAGTFRGQPLQLPLATVCATNDKHLVVPYVAKHYGGEHPDGTPKAFGQDALAPLSTVTARNHHHLTAAFLTKFYGTSTGADPRQPLPTITANDRGGGHLAEVRAFLLKYYGAEGRGQAQGLLEPLHTVTAKARFGVVVVRGVAYQVVDIGMRMLQPHELFGAQGFPSVYVIDPVYNGKPLTKTAQTRLAGNSVCPPQAEAEVRANLEAA